MEALCDTYPKEIQCRWSDMCKQLFWDQHHVHVRMMKGNTFLVKIYCTQICTITYCKHWCISHIYCECKSTRLKVYVTWKIFSVNWKAFQNTGEWHFSFWNIFLGFRDIDVFLLCKLDQWWCHKVVEILVYLTFNNYQFKTFCHLWKPVSCSPAKNITDTPVWNTVILLTALTSGSDN